MYITLYTKHIHITENADQKFLPELYSTTLTFPSFSCFSVTLGANDIRFLATSLHCLV